MTGPKLNEKSYVAGERSGTKAQAKYVRSSASKARVVLDLIRGIDVVSADQILQFTDRHIARDVRKVLASAVGMLLFIALWNSNLHRPGSQAHLDHSTNSKPTGENS